MRLMVLLALLALLAVIGSEDTKQKIDTVKAGLSDPSAVVGATCAPASSPLCRCIVETTVTTLQSGPRELIAILERPDAVWNDLMETVDPGSWAKIAGAKAEAEHRCRARIVPARRLATMERNVHAANDGPRQSLRASCSAEGGSSKACACYEQTLKAALTSEDFEVVRADARFPPLLKEMPAERRRSTLATMAAARAACDAAPG